MPTLQLIFISAVVAIVTSALMAFVFLVGIGMGLFTIVWIPILVMLCRGRLAEPHPLIPDGMFWRVGLWIGSLLLSIMLTLLVAVNLFTRQDHRGVSLTIYFLIVAIFAYGLIRLHGVRRTINWRLLGTGLPIAAALLLVVPQSSVALLDLFMTMLGFRSEANEAVLVDDAAHQDLEEQDGLTVPGPAACIIASLGHPMWYLPTATVIWQGVGDSTLVDSGRPGLAPLVLRPDQVRRMPRLIAPDCDPVIAGPSPPH